MSNLFISQTYFFHFLNDYINKSFKFWICWIASLWLAFKIVATSLFPTPFTISSAIILCPFFVLSHLHITWGLYSLLWIICKIYFYRYLLFFLAWYCWYDASQVLIMLFFAITTGAERTNIYCSSFNMY